MKTAERRNAILKLLQNAEEPVAARKLAERYGVSRQVIVQDMAVIRAYTPGIISTTKGYVMEQEPRCVREFKVRHKQSDAAKELNLIVDCGGRVCNISISHRVYGRVSAEMDIRSRQDVAEFIAALNDSQSTVLSTATSGYHYHLVEAASEERLNRRKGNKEDDNCGNSAGNHAHEKGTGYLYSGACLSGTGDTGSG